MNEEQLEALIAFIEYEAEYAAKELINRNDCSDACIRYEYKDELRKAFNYGR